jgi:hypothetical protein
VTTTLPPAPDTATLPAAAKPRPTVPVHIRPVIRFRSSRPDLLLCFGLLAVILLVQGWNITHFPTLSDDEGTYLA